MTDYEWTMYQINVDKLCNHALKSVLLYFFFFFFFFLVKPGFPGFFLKTHTVGPIWWKRMQYIYLNNNGLFYVGKRVW